MTTGNAAESERMTIDELASVSSMTVRNIRAHQSRGLLPPPEIVGRTGYYGSAHVRRLDQIRQMQDEGLNLAAIAKVLHEGRLTDVAVGVFREDDAAVDPVALMERLAVSPEDALRAISAGVVTIDGDQIRIRSPRLVSVAEELVSLGVPLSVQLDAADAIRTAVEPVAATMMRLAEDHLMMLIAAETISGADAVEQIVERFHTLATQTLLATFDQAMSAEVEAFVSNLRSDLEA